MVAEQSTVWRQRHYSLTVFGSDDRLVTCVDLTEEQAEQIGKSFYPGDGVEGVGEYRLDLAIVRSQQLRDAAIVLGPQLIKNFARHFSVAALLPAVWRDPACG